MADESNFLVEIILRAVDQASGPIRNLNRAVDDLKAKAAAGDVGRLSDSIDDVGRSARDAERDLGSHREETVRHTQATTKHADEVSRAGGAIDEHASSAAAARARVRALGDDTERATRSIKDHSEAVARVSAEYKGWSATSRQAGFSNAENARALTQIGREADQLTRVLPRTSQAWRDMANIAGEARRAARQSGVADEAERLTRSYREFDQMARAGRVTASAAKDSYRDFATSFDRLRDSIDKGSSSWRQFGRLIDDATRKAAHARTVVSGGGLVSALVGNIGDVSRGGGLGSLDRLFQNLSAHADNFGIKIVSLSAQLRGFAIAAGIGLFQQLDSAIVGIVGSLFSLGSAAAQAAATIGGTFIAALGQAIPVIGLAIDAFSRLKLVFQAVQAAANLQQQTATSATQQQISSLSGTNAVITAQQQLSNSYVNVRQAQDAVRISQQGLTIARRDAQRQIIDLMYAEQQAELAAKGANITLAQAQQNLQRVILQGGTGTALESAQLQVEQAQLGARQARTAVPRARFDYQLARRQGVEGAPSVQAAERGLVQARQNLVQAEQAIGNATRALALARLQAAQATSSISTAAHALSYLLGQLSPVERQLFDVLDRLRRYFTDPNSPFNKIADYIVAPFVGGFRRLLTLLNNQSFLAPFDQLAKTMGAGISRIFQTLLGPQGTGFIEEMARDAAKNIPIIVDSITQLIKIFEDIARAAAPALHTFLGDFNRFITALSQRWSTPQGLRGLTDFFNQGAKYAEEFVHWGGALLRLLMALGHDAAPVGGSLLSGWTTSLNNLTSWVQSHGPEVRNFFQQAGQALNAFMGIVGQLGLAMVRLLNAGSLRAFGDLLQQVIVPVLEDAIRVMGAFTNLVIGLLNSIPGLRIFVTAFGGLAVAAVVIGKLYAPLRQFILLLASLKAGGAAFAAMRGAGGGLLESLNAAKTATAERLATERGIIGAIQAQTAALQEQLGVQREVQAGLATEEVQAAALAAEMGVSPGGVILPGGAGRTAAGVGGAEAAGGGGLLATLGGGGVASAVLGPAAIGAAAIWIATHTGGAQPGTTASGLGSVLGPVGGTHVDKNVLDRINPFGGTGFLGLGPATSPNQAAGTVRSLKGLQDALKGVADPAQLSHDKLVSLYREAQRVRQLPDITATQRHGLDQLVKSLNPATVAIKQLEQQWASTFQGINATTGDVMQQVKQVLATDIHNISINLGTGTKQGAEALSATIAAAWNSVLRNTTAAERGTARGVQAINKMLRMALSAFGFSAGDIQALGTVSPAHVGDVLAEASNIALQPGGVAAGAETGARLPHRGRAQGGWNPAQPGGMLYRAGEAGHDEVTLTTDPKHSDRQRMLLSQYLERVPHMDAGGYVFPFPRGERFGWNRIDQGQDLQGPPGGPVLAVGPGFVSVGHDAFSGFGPFYPIERLTSGPWAGRSIYYGHAKDTHVGGVRAGEIIGVTQARANEWTAAPAGWLELGFTSALGQGVHGQGAAVAPMLHALAAGHMVAGTGGIGQIRPPKVGVRGAMGAIGQGTLNIITKAANQYLAGIAGTVSSAVSGVSTAGLSGSLTAIVKQISGRMGWMGQVQDWLNLIRKESGGSMTARNPKSGAYGIAQFIDGPGEYKKYGGNASTLIGQLVAMANYIKERYVSPARAWAHEQSSNWYDIGGLIGRLAPWGGRPVPIVAHEGERISNPQQWAHLAGLVGTTPSGLDAHMGYDRKSPRQSFDDGGVPSVASMLGGSGGSASNPFSLVNPVWGRISAIGRLVTLLNMAFRKMHDVGAKSDALTKRFTPFIDQLLTQDTGLFDRLNTAFTTIQNLLAAAVVIGGRAAGRGMAAAQRGYLRRFPRAFQVGPHGLVTQVLSPAQQDEEQIRALNEQRTYLLGERSLVGSALAQVQRRLQTVRRLARHDPSKYKNALTKLTSEYNNLIGRMQNLTGAIAQGVSSAFQAEQTHIQDILGRLSDTVGTQQAQIQSQQDIAQTMGGAASTPAQFAAAGAISAGALQANRVSIQQQISSYTSALAQAKAIGDTSTVATITQALAQLDSQLVANTQAIKDNTAQTVAQTSEYIQSRGQFQTGIYGGLMQAIQTIGQTMGAVDVASLKALAERSNQSLQGTNAQLVTQLMALGGGAIPIAQMLAGVTDPAQMVAILSHANLIGAEAGQDSTWIQAFEGIISSLTSNTEAIAQNNQQLAQLNGQLLQPQTWASMTWTAFRQAVFTGMGNLMPSYQATLPAGSAPMIAPTYGPVSSNTTRGPTIGELNITHPVEVLDPQVLGEQLYHELSTTPASA